MIERNRQTRISVWNQNCPTIVFLVFLCRREIWYRMIICKPCQTLEGILKYFKILHIMWILCDFICKHQIFYCYHCSHSTAENYKQPVTAQYDPLCEWRTYNLVLLMHTYLVIGFASKIPCSEERKSSAHFWKQLWSSGYSTFIRTCMNLTFPTIH